MWIRKEKYLCEKMIAEKRIKHLEHIVCPNGHDYAKFPFKNYEGKDGYVCSRCGKIKIEGEEE